MRGLVRGVRSSLARGRRGGRGIGGCRDTYVLEPELTGDRSSVLSVGEQGGSSKVKKGGRRKRERDTNLNILADVCTGVIIGSSTSDGSGGVGVGGGFEGSTDGGGGCSDPGGKGKGVIGDGSEGGVPGGSDLGKGKGVIGGSDLGKGADPGSDPVPGVVVLDDEASLSREFVSTIENCVAELDEISAVVSELALSLLGLQSAEAWIKEYEKIGPMVTGFRDREIQLDEMISEAAASIGTLTKVIVPSFEVYEKMKGCLDRSATLFLPKNSPVHAFLFDECTAEGFHVVSFIE